MVAVTRRHRAHGWTLRLQDYRLLTFETFSVACGEQTWGETALASEQSQPRLERLVLLHNYGASCCNDAQPHSRDFQVAALCGVRLLPFCPAPLKKTGFRNAAICTCVQPRYVASHASPISTTFLWHTSWTTWSPSLLRGINACCARLARFKLLAGTELSSATSATAALSCLDVRTQM